MSDKVLFPFGEPEFGRAWSSCAGKLAGLREAQHIVSLEAQGAFIRRQDDMANQLRAIAGTLERRVSKVSDELDQYINEGDLRRGAARKGETQHG